MKKHLPILVSVVRSLYEGEGQGQGQGQGQDQGQGSGNQGSGNQGQGAGAAGSGSGNQGQGQGQGSGNQGQNVPPTFSQEQQAYINSLLVKEKRKFSEANKAATQQLIEQLEQQRNLATTTGEQKESLQQQIDSLKATFQTTEEDLKSQVSRWEKKYNTDTEKLIKDKDNWKVRHDRNLKRVAIAGAAVQHEAFNVSQIEALLLPLMETEEELDGEGKPTGEYVPFVNWKDVKDGKPITLKLSPDAAVKLMKEKVDQYGNLFKNGAVPGTGSGQGNGSLAGSGIPDLETMTTEQYSANRDKIMAATRKQAGRS